jgi:hypothetical protein
VISVYAPGATSPFRVIHSSDPVASLAVASDGTIYVDTYSHGILVYPHGKKRGVRSFDPQAQVLSIALGPSGS